MRAPLRATLAFLLALGACSSAEPTEHATAAATASGSQAPPPALPPPPAPEVQHDEPAREYVPRATIDEVLEAGMGRLLGRVRVEPAREGSRFVGYRVVDLDPTWDGGPVRVGDVVVRLNGMDLQTPDAAQRAVGTLAVASEIVLEVIRDGVPTRTHLAIQ